ncbi:MAG TPA: FAD-binding oxidoreductase [Mycobacteriales bacterium]|nr:FAD-binding oxidoreductase [Mycobacteriales bacterium]
MTTVWEATATAGPPELPPLREPTTADVVVVGLGAAGLTAAVRLAGAGLDVLALDRHGVAAGASGRNGGFLLAGLAEPHHRVVARVGRERAAALHRLTAEALEATAARHPDAVGRVGSLRVSRSAEEDEDVAAQLAAMRADGLPVEPYDGPEGRGLLFPLDGGFQPFTRACGLARAAASAGARLRTADVTQVSGAGVRTTAGSVEARRGVLVAVDGGLERLVPALAGRVRSARLQMLATAPAGDVTVERPVYARYGLDYWQQLPDGRLALGGGRDVGGDDEWVDGPGPAPVSDPVQAHLERLLRDDVGTAAPVEHRWTGVVAFTPDALPVLAEPEPGLLAVGGYSGTGNLVGPLCAGWAAERLLGRHHPLDDLLLPPR